MTRCQRLSLSPWFIFSLIVLLVNDHYLKAAHSSILTGKLSDFAGLFVFAVFLFVLFGRYLDLKYRLVGLHVVVGVAFVVWKIAPVEILLDNIGRTLSIPVPSRVKDATDLIALTILPLSYLLIKSRMTMSSSRLQFGIYRKLAASGVLLLAAFAIMATSVPLEPLPPEMECIGMRGNANGDESEIVDVADTQAMIDYLWLDGPLPRRVMEADVDASGGINPISEADVEYLIVYLFESGPPPADCPCNRPDSL